MIENIVIDTKFDLEEKKQRKREYKHQHYLDHKEEYCNRAKKWREDNPEQYKENKKKYYIKNKEQECNRSKTWLKENKERAAKTKKEYGIKNKDKIKQHKKDYQENNKEKIKKQQKDSAQRNKKNIKIYKEQYYELNKEWILKEQKEKRENEYEKRLNEKVNLINLFGGECVWCKKTNPDILVFDHIHDDGAEDRKKNKIRSTIAIVKRELRRGSSIETLKETYQLLCANCNALKQYKKYFDLPDNEITNQQRYKIKIWKEAYNFFGPCKLCGETDLKLLSIDHINGDGNAKRRDGERVGAGLLSKFRKMGWPEDIKEEYQLLCFNCHYGVKPKLENPKLSVQFLK
jgi:hypothetical protein